MDPKVLMVDGTPMETGSVSVFYDDQSWWRRRAAQDVGLRMDRCVVSEAISKDDYYCRFAFFYVGSQPSKLSQMVVGCRTYQNSLGGDRVKTSQRHMLRCHICY